MSLLERMAVEKQASIAQLSLAWVLAQKPYIVPIPGSSKKERISENAQAVNIRFSSQQMAELNKLLAESDFPVFGELEKTGGLLK